jgi:hypothetical protein
VGCSCFWLAGSAGAQTPAERLLQPGVLSIGVAGGGAAFSDFQRGQATAGAEEFDRRISAQTTVAVSGNITYWISRYWGVRAHASFSPSRFVLNEADHSSGRISANANLARLGIFMADADVLFRVPLVWGRVAPYGIVGAGAVVYHADPGSTEPIPAEAEGSFRSNTRRQFAGVFGVGAMIPLERNSFHLTFEVTNHLTGSPVDVPMTGMTEDGRLLLDPDGWGNEDDGAGLTSNVRLLVGIAFPLSW